MGYWNRSETEFIINLAGREPAIAYVSTNWASYVNKLKACQGFQMNEEWIAPDGRSEINGQVSLNPFRFIHLRSKLALSSHDQWKQEKEQLPQFTQVQTPFRLGPGERETVISAVQDEPFWAWACTDMMWWMKTLDANQWAVPVREVQYAGADDGGSAVQKTYAVPRALLQIRRSRPQLSDEQRAGLLERLKG